MCRVRVHSTLKGHYTRLCSTEYCPKFIFGGAETGTVQLLQRRPEDVTQESQRMDQHDVSCQRSHHEGEGLQIRSVIMETETVDPFRGR